MKILVVADEECPSLWDYYKPGCLSKYQLILSCGDVNPKYLTFLVTMARCPVIYVHGNHDVKYTLIPPEGCDLADDKLIVYNGLRILGLGGCMYYNRPDHQYTERQMKKRVKKLKRAIKMAGGVDILLTHAPAAGIGDGDDPAHTGFQSFLDLMKEYHPRYMFHGHVHLNYSHDSKRVLEYADTKIVNCWQKYELDYDAPIEPLRLTLLQKIYAKLFVKNLEILN